ncbi:MAG: tetratricopeptide repeat protein [Saprospiraceae bacterium]
MEFTVIIMGRLEFASARSVVQATNTLVHLLETRYKGDVLYRDAEQLLDAEKMALVCPREKFTCTEKMWLNTLHLLERAAEYSIAGDLNLWRIADGELLEYQLLEPIGDKTTIQAYRKGRSLIEAGAYSDAIASLTNAIKGCDRHACALERRGYAYYEMGNEEAAMADYAASLAVDAKRPDAYLSRALIYIRRKDWKAAWADLDMAMKRSMPHHNVYLEALHRKGNCEMEMGQFEAALKSFHFFLTRPLKKDHPQYLFRRQVTFDKGRTLAAAGDLDAAIATFDEALKLPLRNGKPDMGEVLLHRGLAFQQSGKSGFVEDWQKAADQGSKKAKELLAEVG